MRRGWFRLLVAKLLFAVMVTFISAIIVIGLQPLTQSVECGDGKVLDFIEDFLEDLWALVSRGASATSMVLWYHFASTLESVGMEETSGFAKLKLLVVFTGLVFFVGAFISVKLEQMEEHLRSLQKVKPQPWRGAAVRFSDVLQNTLGYVAGFLVTDVVTSVFTSLNEGPSLDVLIWNILLAAGWTLLASAYLGRVGEQAMTADRDAVERYFLVNSGAFFVGWMWFVVAQDVITVFGIFFRAACGPLGLERGADAADRDDDRRAGGDRGRAVAAARARAADGRGEWRAGRACRAGEGGDARREAGEEGDKDGGRTRWRSGHDLKCVVQP